MKILTKGLLLVAIPTLFELLLLGVLIKSQAQFQAAERTSLMSNQILAQTTSILLPTLSNAQRWASAILRKQSSVRSESAELTQLQTRVAQLARLVGDNPHQRARIERISVDLQRYVAAAQRIATLLESSNGESAKLLFEETQLTSALDRLQPQLAGLMLDEQRARDAAVQELTDARATQGWLLIAAVIGSLFAAAIAVWMFSRNIGARLSTLTLNARRLADGTALAAQVSGNDEISELDTVLHQTSRRLLSAEQTALSYKSQLEKHAAELTEVNQHLRQQTEDNEMFVYSVSHDLRSPLVNLQGFSKEIMHACKDLNKAIVDAQLDPEQRQRIATIVNGEIMESLHFIQNAVLRTANIIDALLRLSRAGRVEYQFQTVATAAIVQRVIDSMQSTVRDRNATIDVETLPAVWADPTALEQVFANLIGNALNYLSPQRAGQIAIGATLEQVDQKNVATFYVRDNGLGIHADYAGKIFSAFQRFHGAVAKGEGIGLTLVRRMVERHGGRIWFESVEHQGSTFYVSLPLAPA